MIGAGIAGIAAVESIVAATPSAQITLISQEVELPYYRLNLTRYLAGEVKRENLVVHPAAWYEERNIRFAFRECKSIAIAQPFGDPPPAHKRELKIVTALDMPESLRGDRVRESVCRNKPAGSCTPIATISSARGCESATA